MLRETDPEHPHGTGHLFWALLDVLDAERRRGRVYEDAVLFALFFLPIVRARVRESRPDGEPSPALLSTLIEDLVTPLAIRMALPSRRLAPHQAGPDDRRASFRTGPIPAWRPRLAFREAFPTALELFELRAMATGRGEELVRDWRALAARVEKTRQALRPRDRAAARSPPAAPPARRPRQARGAGLEV